MYELNETAKEAFLKLLDSGHFFSRWQFDTKFNNPNGEILRCTLLDKPVECYFVITQFANITTWRVTESPGKNFTIGETTDFGAYSLAVGAVPQWLQRVLALSLKVPTKPDSFEAVNSLREKLDSAANALSEPNTPFSQEQVDEWTVKFQEFVANLRKLEADNASLKSRLDALDKQLELLKQEGATIPKRSWLKAVGNKVIDAMTEGLKGGAKLAGTEAAKQLLEYFGSGK